MNDWGEFQGLNAAYVAELYERFQRDPNSVDGATREFFTHWTPPLAAEVSSPAEGSLARHKLNQEAIVRRALSTELGAGEVKQVLVKQT